MHKLYDLKDKLIEELEDYSENGKYSKEDVESIKYLASAVDHLCNICEDAEDDMSFDDGMGGMTSNRGYSRERGGNYSMRRGYSRARGRGSNARRDSMGRYSRADGEDVETIKAEVRKLADKVEQM